jgi:hypothetical protein
MLVFASGHDLPSGREYLLTPTPSSTRAHTFAHKKNVRRLLALLKNKNQKLKLQRRAKTRNFGFTPQSSPFTAPHVLPTPIQ